MPLHIADAYSDSPFAKRQTGLIFGLPVPDPTIEQLPAGVSLCMIVKNEERFLEACLASVKGAVDEINIVDTGSTDRTVEIARAHGANVIFREWRNDFSWARNQGLAMATRRWTLILDADEELTAPSVPLVRAVGQTPAALTALYVNIVNFVDDRMGAGTASHRLARFFPTNPKLRYVNVIHESLTIDEGELDVKLSPISILHKGYTADMLKVREKNSRNMPLLQQAYEEHGDDPFSLFNFGNAAICGENYEVGIEVLERMLAMQVEPKMYFPIAYVMLAQAHIEWKGDYEQAFAILEKGRERFPGDASLLFMRGQAHSKLERFEEARADFNRVIQLRDEQLATVLTDEEIFEWKVYYAMAGTYELEDNLAEAVRCIERALVNKPNSAPMLRAAATMYERLERYHDADVHFRRCAEADPSAGQVELANFLLRRSRFAEAAELVENMGERADESLRVLVHLVAARAMVEMQAGDPTRHFEAALRAAPGNGEVLALYDEFLTARGEHERLARLRRDELEAPLVHAGDYTRRVTRLLAERRNADAAEVATLARARFPDDARLAFNAGLAFARSGNAADAVAAFASIPTDAGIVYADAMQLHATLKMRLGDPAAAAISLRAWANAQRDVASSLISGAQWLAESGARDAAIGLLREREDDPAVAAALASQLFAAGDFTAAGSVANRALG
jgi:glycosyltransferase involved in cell wall biosynthesis/Tfp pilus assembly protein PilF